MEQELKLLITPLPTGFPPTTALGLGVSTQGSSPLYSAASPLKPSPRSKRALDVPFLSSLSTDSFTNTQQLWPSQPLTAILPFQVLESLHYLDLNPTHATTMNQATAS